MVYHFMVRFMVTAQMRSVAILRLKTNMPMSTMIVYKQRRRVASVRVTCEVIENVSVMCFTNS